MLKYLKYLKYLILLAIVSFVGYDFIRSLETLDDEFKSGIAAYPKIKDTYYTIFPESSRDKLELRPTFFRKRNNPTASFSDKSKDYILIVNKYELAKEDQTIADIIQLTPNKAPIPTNKAHHETGKTSEFKVYHSFDSIPALTQLFVSLKGENIKTLIKTDSLINYAMNLNELQISRTETANAFNIVSQEGLIKNSKNYFEILFLKKEKSLFVIYKLKNYAKNNISDEHLYKLFIQE